MASRSSSMALTAALVVVVGLCGAAWAEEASPLAKECASKLPQVISCVAFASGREAKPQGKCCEAVKEMRESNPACLCFLIQQIHNGTDPKLQQLNIKESRLLQLPSACNIPNANITDCPRLLKLPPNSPDASIFNNAALSSPTPNSPDGSIITNAPVSSPTVSSMSSPATNPPSSHGFKHEAFKLRGPFIPIILLFTLMFPLNVFRA